MRQRKVRKFNIEVFHVGQRHKLSKKVSGHMLCFGLATPQLTPMDSGQILIISCSLPKTLPKLNHACNRTSAILISDGVALSG